MHLFCGDVFQSIDTVVFVEFKRFIFTTKYTQNKVTTDSNLIADLHKQ